MIATPVRNPGLMHTDRDGLSVCTWFIFSGLQFGVQVCVGTLVLVFFP